MLLLAEYAAVATPEIFRDKREEEGNIAKQCLLQAAVAPPPGDVETPPDLRPVLTWLLQRQSNAQKAALCLFLAEQARKNGILFAPWQKSPEGECRLRYMPTMRTEKAYRILCAVREDIRVSYARNAQDAVSDVDTGKADFCLLPKEDENGIPALYMERLTEKYDLFPAALLRFVPEGEENPVLFAVYGKAGRSFCLSEKEKTDIRLSGDGTLPLSLAHLTEAAGLFAFRAEHAFCRADAYGRMRAALTLSEGGDTAALWLYLSLFSEEWTGFARYPFLSEEGKA